MRSFIVVVTLGTLLFLASVTCLGGGVPITWFGFEAGFVNKDIVDNGKGLGSNLERRSIKMIVSLRWDIC